MYHECRHIMPRGTKCKSPSLRGKYYCFYHEKLHIYTQDGSRADKAPLALPSIEDASGIQLALMQIMGSIATRRLDARQAGSLLYALQIGIQALDRVPQTPPEELVEMTYCDGIGADIGIEQTRCEPYDGCATCAQTACVNVARQNKQSMRQVLDAERAQRETPHLLAIESATPRLTLDAPTQHNLPEPVPESIESQSIEKDRIDKFRPHIPEPEPELSRKALDRLALELRRESDLAAEQRSLPDPPPSSCQRSDDGP